jgi:hypothetical protein
MITLAAYLLFGRDFGMAARDVVWQINFVVLFFVIPYLNRGKGLGPIRESIPIRVEIDLISPPMLSTIRAS